MSDFEDFERVWFLTWTTYATWLPGDERGFVSPKFEKSSPEKRTNQPGTPYDQGHPELNRLAQSKVVGQPVYLTKPQSLIVQTQLNETACYRNWNIIAGAIMANHVHLLVGVKGDPDPATLLRDFKSYASRALNQQFPKPQSGKWWTEQGSKRIVKNVEGFENVRRYIMKQEKPLCIWE